MANSEINESDGKLVCTLEGHFDTLESQKLDEALKSRLAGPQPVVFDMKGVTYVCSSFLRVCLSVAKSVGTGCFKTADMTPQIKRVFMSAGFSEMFDNE